MEVTVSLDNQSYNIKPQKVEITKISKRLGNCQCSADIQDLAYKIGEEGYTFCPAVFSNGRRRADNFDKMQIIALDFDCGIAFEEIKKRADRYRLPITFAYSTFSSTDALPKFRVVFLNDVEITERHVAEIMIHMLLKIFKEADKSCQDVSRIFFGGKGLIGSINQESINIIGLVEGFQQYIFETQPKNYAREIEQFAKVNEIACIRNCLQIFCVHRDGRFEAFSEIHPYIYGSETVFPSNCPKYRIITHYQPDERKKLFTSQTSFGVVHGDFKTIEQKCQLFHDFVKEPHIHHNERFLLLTNLLYISGGCKRFQSIIVKKNYDEQEWRFYAKYIKDRGYKPQSCDGHCPYAMVCNHSVNMVNTVQQKENIRRVYDEEPYYQLEEVYNFIETCLQEAVTSSRDGIYLVPAQTAVGKTESYCNLIKNEINRRFLIAVPTNQLKREIAERLQRNGIRAEVTLSLDEMNIVKELEHKIRFYYEIGLGIQIVRILYDYIKENKSSTVPEIMNTVNQCSAYIKLNDSLKENRVVVTTHARLLTLAPDIINQFTVIVDEDILSTIFKNIRTVSLQSVRNVFESERCPEILKKRLEQIIRYPNGKYGKLNDIYSFEYLLEQELEELDVYDNVNEIVTASVFEKDGTVVHYFSPQRLVEGKYIILSATVNSDLYRRYFPGLYIKEYPYYRSRYKGKLKQLTAYSMSRQCIQEHKEELDIFLRQLQGKYQMITFMKFEDEFGSSGLHFGNVEGVDWMKGKNVIVIGTPHLNEFVYKLIGCHLGVEVNPEVLAVRRIQHKGYEFNLMTYKNEVLRELQTFFISKELEQCIGRARLLRNDCTVIVLSNFPCEQAELIQKDYLREMVQEELMKACSPDMAGEL